MIYSKLFIFILFELIFQINAQNGTNVEIKPCAGENCTICENGYELDLNTGKCTSIREVITPKCPNGFTYDNGRCIQYTNIICPRGTYLKHGFCHRNTTCPIGSHFVNGQCQQQKTNCRPICNSGYTLRNDMCHQTRPVSCGTRCTMNQEITVTPILSCSVSNSQCTNPPCGLQNCNNPPCTSFPCAKPPCSSAQYSNPSSHSTLCTNPPCHNSPIMTVTDNYPSHSNHPCGTGSCPNLPSIIPQIHPNPTTCQNPPCPNSQIHPNPIASQNPPCPMSPIHQNPTSCPNPPVPIPPISPNPISCSNRSCPIIETPTNPTSCPNPPCSTTPCENSDCRQPVRPIPQCQNQPCQPEIETICNTPCSTNNTAGKIEPEPVKPITTTHENHNQIDLRNFVNNNNMIKNENKVNVNNVNNIFVYNSDKIVTTSCKDNNCTTVEFTSERPLITSTSTSTTTEIIKPMEKTPCCMIVTPRLCKKVNSKWKCYNRRYSRCGDFCTQPVIYLKPRKPINRPPIVVMPPMTHIPYCGGRGCNSDRIDCSGCLTSDHCSPTCYEYFCPANVCDFHDHTSFCEDFGGNGCDDIDGCYGDNCSADEE